MWGRGDSNGVGICLESAVPTTTLLIMSANRDQAVCIRCWDFSETSQTVSLLTRDHGLVRGLAKGAKRERGSFGGGFALLTRGEILWISKKERDLVTLTQWDLLEVFPILTRHLAAHDIGMYAIDLIGQSLTDSDPHPALFDRLVETLRALEQEADVFGVLLYFQWSLLTEAGYQPVLDRDAMSGEAITPRGGATVAFSARGGGTVHDTGERDRWRVRRDTIELLQQVATKDSIAGVIELVGGKSDTVERANRLLAAYWRAILDREPATMRRVLGDLRV